MVTEPYGIEIRDGMHVTWDAPVEMDDGLVLRADLFVVFRVFGPDLKEVTSQGANDPHTPIGLGWLRASRRKLDPERSLDWRPYHTHDEARDRPPRVFDSEVTLYGGPGRESSLLLPIIPPK